MRRRASGKVDKNQPEVVKALRDAGWHVCITSSLKHGVPDLVVSKGGWMAYVEVKASPKDKLTTDEAIFAIAQQGPYVILWDAPNADCELNIAFDRHHGLTPEYDRRKPLQSVNPSSDNADSSER